MEHEHTRDGHLIQELEETRNRVAELEQHAADCRHAELLLQENNERYRILAENVQDVIWAADTDFRFTYISPSSIKMFGYTPEEIMSQSFASAYTDESCEKITEHLSEAMVWIREGHVPEDRRSMTIEARRYRKDGSIIWVEITTNALFDKKEQLIGLVGVTRDITGRKQAEEELAKYREQLEEIVKERTIELDLRNNQLEKEVAERERVERSLRESEALYRLLATNASDIIFTMDMDLRFTFISPSVSRIRGFTVEEAMSQMLTEALTPASLEFAINVFLEETAIEMKDSKDISRVRTIELEETCKDGSTVWTETAFSLLRDEKSTLTGILGITRDISDRKRAEEEKKSLENQLLHAQKIEALDRFAGGIAHDLNNILYPIIINIQGLLEYEQYDSDRRDILEQTLKAAYRQRDLVKMILSFSRRSERVLKPLKVIPLLEETVGFLRSSLPSTIEIQQSIDVQNDTIMGDPVQIQQIIMNLCQNAADAYVSQKGTVEVGLSNTHKQLTDSRQTLESGVCLKITVKDTGIGMKPEVMDRAFEPFFTSKILGKGTGLGLSVVHGIVKSHGGIITAESGEGKGSLFTVYLPVIDPKHQGQALHGESTMKKQQGKESILLVDDEEIILSSVKRVLSLSGYGVVACKDSLEALQLFNENPDEFDLVITDLTMPEMTGIELAEKIQETRPDIPIILCTGFNDVISQQEARALGIKELILKPVGTGELKKVILRALEN